MRLTVTYREEGGFMGSNIATSIEVEQGQGFQSSPSQDPGSQRYGETRDQSTLDPESTQSHDQTSTRTPESTQHESGTWTQDRDRSTASSTPEATSTQQESETWAQDRDQPTTSAQDQGATQTEDHRTTHGQDQTSQASQQYGSQQSSFSGELVDVDTTEQKLTVRNEQGEEMEFSYSSQTEVSGADQSIAGLATQSGSKVTVEYSDSGEGQSNEKTAQKIQIEQEWESQQDR